MDLMSPSKDVLNAHIPYVHLVAISSLLLRGTLDDSQQRVEKCHGALQWLSGCNIPRTYQSAGAACILNKLVRARSCLFLFSFFCSPH